MAYYVVSSGKVSSGIILSNDLMDVFSGGTANSTTLNNQGYLCVSSSGSANSTTVNSGASMFVYSGGKATVITENGGYVWFAPETTVTFAPHAFSGLVFSDFATVHSGTTAVNPTVNSGGDLIVNQGGTVVGANINYSGRMDVFSGGTANKTTVNYWGSLAVSRGTANYTTVNSGGYLDVFSGGTANSTTLNNQGYLCVSSSGSANSTTVNSGASMFVYSGGKATVITENGGYVWFAPETTVTFAPHAFSGLVFSDFATVHSGTTAVNPTVNSGGDLIVKQGGTVVGANINYSGRMDVSSGGTASSAKVNYGGSLDVSSGGRAYNLSADNYGGIYVYNGSAYRTTIGDNSWLLVFSGGMVSSTTLNSGASMFVCSSGMANNVTVNSGGILFVSSGAMLRGSINLAGVMSAGGSVNASGAIINLAVNGRNPNASYMINNISQVSNASYTITVSSTQAQGTYCLATGANNFNQNMTVKNTSGNTLGTISVGGTLTSGNNRYTLRKNGSDLVIDISFPDPYENNDTAEAAYNLGTLSGEKQLTGGTVTSTSDEDWFKFTIDTSGTANDYLQIDFDNRMGDLDLYLYAWNGTTKLLSSVSTVSDTEKISLRGIPRGTYYVKVVGKNGAKNGYTLSTRKVIGYDPDMYDTQSRNDTLATATALDVSQMTKHTIFGLNIHDSSDVDYYRITLSDMGIIGDSISIDFTHSVGDLDLYLYDSTGKLVNRSISTGNTESISLNGVAAGTYYVKVAGYNAAVNEYALSWDISRREAIPDAYEGREPVAISDSMEIKGLTISPARAEVTREDTFTITLNATGTSASKIRFTNYRSDWNGLKYTVKNSSGTTVRSGTAAEISLQGLAKGSYTLTVDTPVADTYGSYDISVSLPEAVQQAGKQAILVYVCGDNNGHNRYLYDIVSMQQTQLQDNVEVYVLLDRSSNLEDQQNWDFDYENWTDTRVAKVTYNPSYSPQLDWVSWGELNTGSIRSLQRFLDWSMSEAMADNYTLVIKDHGNACGEICFDGTKFNENESYNLSANSIADLLKGYRDISVVAFDACDMGSEFMLPSMAGVCDYVIASEAPSLSMGGNIRWNEFLSSISADVTPEMIAEAFIDSVNPTTTTTLKWSPSSSYYLYGSDYSHTLAAYDVSQDYFSAALNTFAAASDNFTITDWKLLAKIFKTAYSYGSCFKDLSFEFSDLGLIIDKALRLSACSAEFTRAVTQLSNDIDGFVKYHVAVPSSFGQSFSVFNPIISNPAAINYYTSLSGNANAQWFGFLQKLNQYRNDADTVRVSDNFSKTLFVSEEGNNAFDLGAFCGTGVSFDNLNVIGEDYFSFISTRQFTSGDVVTISPADAAANIQLSLYDESMNLIAQTGDNVLSLSNITSSQTTNTYILKVLSDTISSFSLQFGANWTTGCDRFDYLGSQINQKNVNGNGSAEKATSLILGKYSGLVTYAGDSDWFKISAEDDDVLAVSVNGSGLSVAEYDASGNLVQTAAYANGKYSMTMKSQNYLYVEGNADIGLDQVNAYALDISNVLNVESPYTISGLVLDNSTYNVESGYMALDTTVNAGGTLNVVGGGQTNNTVINNGGAEILASGAFADLTTVNWGGGLHVYSGATARRTTVNQSGYLGVGNGATAVSTTVGEIGEVTIWGGGVASQSVIKTWGAMILSSGARADGTIINDKGGLHVYSGAVADHTTVNQGGIFGVGDGAVVNDTDIGVYGELTVWGGGVANRTDIASGGALILLSGAVASGTDIQANGGLHVYSGARADNTLVNQFGYFGVGDGAVVNSTAIGDYGELKVWGGGVANRTDIAAGGALILLSGAQASGTEIQSGGGLHVYSGARASGTTVYQGGFFGVGGGALVVSTTVGEAGEVIVWGGGYALDNVIETWGAMILSSGARADRTDIHVNGGLHIYAGAQADAVTIREGATLGIGSAGKVDTVIEEHGAGMVFYDGAQVSGRIQMGGTVTVNGVLDGSNAVFVFDLTNRTTGDGIIMNSMQLVTNTSFQVSVSSSQQAGWYALAGGAYRTTLTVNVDSAAAGSISVGGSALQVGNNFYSLGLSNGVLSLGISKGSVQNSARLLESPEFWPAESMPALDSFSAAADPLASTVGDWDNGLDPADFNGLTSWDAAAFLSDADIPKLDPGCRTVPGMIA